MYITKSGPMPGGVSKLRFQLIAEKGRSFVAKSSLSRAGMLSFNNGAVKRYNLGDYGFVRLYFDPISRQVGVEPTNDGDSEGARTLRHRTTGAYVAAKSFVDVLDLKLKDTEVFDLDKDEESGFLVLDLKKGKPRKQRAGAKDEE